MIDLAILILTSLVNFILALTVFIRNRKSAINQFFGVSVVFFIVWTLFNYFADHAADRNLLFARLTFAAAVPIAAYLYEFTRIFPTNRSVNARILQIFQRGLAILAMGISFTPGIVAGVNKTTVGIDLTLGSLYPLYAFYIVETLIIIIRNLYRHFKAANPKQRNQIKFVSLGIILYAVLAITSNLILPAIIQDWASSRFGPIFTMLFVIFVTYSIARHRLLDIRLVIAKSVGYTLLLLTLGFGYALSVFGISSLLFPGQIVNSQQLFIYVALSLVLAFTFQPLRRFYEKVTDRIFFRGSYDTQQVLNELGQLFASQIDINVITGTALKIICERLRLTQGRLIVVDGKKLYRITEYGKPPYQEPQVSDLFKIHRRLIIADELEANKLKQYLEDFDISAGLRLETKESIVGFLLLGPKQNGAIYTTQDTQLLQIIGSDLAVAVQNARSYEKIADFNVTLQKRIDEATKTLRAQNVRLKELDQAKDEFVSMASHQLRTPLTSIKGYLSMMLEGDAGKLNDRQHDFIDLAFLSAQRMVYLIADMLNVSRISTGKLTIDKTPLDLGKIIKEEIAQLERSATARNVRFEFSADSLPKVYLDEGKMREVTMNFLDNAIRYAPSSTVKVELKKIGDKVRYSVHDRGIGVPKADQKQLFTKFFRAHNALKFRPDGTGLGLYMARTVIEMQGGKIIFESTEGKGSIFGFEFPVALISKPPAKATTKAKAPTVAG